MGGERVRKGESRERNYSSSLGKTTQSSFDKMRPYSHFRRSSTVNSTALRIERNSGYPANLGMTRLPGLGGKEFIRILEKIGFRVVRTRGSHLFLRHVDGRVTTVPVHAGEVLGPGLLRSILRAVELTVDDLLKWL